MKFYRSRGQANWWQKESFGETKEEEDVSHASEASLTENLDLAINYWSLKRVGQRRYVSALKVNLGFRRFSRCAWVHDQDLWSGLDGMFGGLLLLDRAVPNQACYQLKVPIIRGGPSRGRISECKKFKWRIT